MLATIASKKRGQSIILPTLKDWGMLGMSAVFSQSTYSEGIQVVGENGYQPMSYKVRMIPDIGPLRCLALWCGSSDASWSVSNWNCLANLGISCLSRESQGFILHKAPHKGIGVGDFYKDFNRNFP